MTAVSRSLFLAALAAVSLPASAFAQDEIRLDEIEVTAPLPSVAGAASAGYPGGTTGIGGGLRPVDAASAGIISGAAINSRPITRPGEVLESVPVLALKSFKAQEESLSKIALDSTDFVSSFTRPTTAPSDPTTLALDWAHQLANPKRPRRSFMALNPQHDPAAGGPTSLFDMHDRTD